MLNIENTLNKEMHIFETHDLAEFKSILFQKVLEMIEKRLHYKDFNEFLNIYGNKNWEEFTFEFRNFLNGFRNLKKEEKMEFIKDINFEIIKDEKIRAFVNSSIRHLLVTDLDFEIEDIKTFKNYFTDKYVLKEPFFPKQAKSYLKIYCLFRSPNEFCSNNIFFGENPNFIVQEVYMKRNKDELLQLLGILNEKLIMKVNKNL